MNLKDEKNEELREKIILGDISPKILSIMNENVISFNLRNQQALKLERNFMKKKKNSENKESLKIKQKQIS